jgi:hypothetical protein
MRPTWSPRGAYLRCAHRQGITPLSVQGTTAIPRPVWLLGDLARVPDAVLKPILPLQIGIEYIFEKNTRSFP